MQIIKNKLFLLGLFIRLPLLFIPGSSYLNELFIPFLDQSIQNGLWTNNPWELSPPHFFPYGSFLFSILAIPRWTAFQLMGDLALGVTPLGLFLVKSPLLIFDLLLFQSLQRMIPNSSRQMNWFYWLNPIAIYISYLHGQLDIVMVTLVVVSLEAMIKKRIFMSAVFLALATSSKALPLILIPFIFAYIWNHSFIHKAIHNILAWSLTYISIVFVGFLPLIKAKQMWFASFANPEAQRLFSFKISLDQGDGVLYVGLLIVLGVLGRLCLSSKITPEGLFLGVGLLFSSILLVTNPMPGWFFWIVPFIAYTYSRNKNFSSGFYLALTFFYFVHFLFFPYLQDSSLTILKPFTLTLLQTSLLGFMLAVWHSALRWETPLTRRSQPMLIGLVGNSGSGKNHFSKLISDLTGFKYTQCIEGDDYHRWERGAEQWKTVTHLNPHANQLEQLTQHTFNLKKGMSIVQPHYDHHSGLFTLPRETVPARTIVVQGLHSLYSQRMRDVLDVKIFLKPDEKVLHYWKAHRDIHTRGYSLEHVLKNIEKRKEDSEKFIYPQEQFADWIIETVFEKDEDIYSLISQKELSTPDTYMKYTLRNEVLFQELAEEISKNSNTRIHVTPLEQDFSKQMIEIHGSPSQKEIEEIGSSFFKNLRQTTRNRKSLRWRDGIEGIHQLFLLAFFDLKQ